MFNSSHEQVYRLLRPFVEWACFDITVKVDEGGKF